MRITVLGKSPAVPDADGACSGYLVSEEGDVLVDCGTGVFSKLRSVCDPRAVKAVLITHVHADHIMDLLPYSHALSHVYGGGAKPLLLGPPGSTAVLGQIAAAFGMTGQIEDAFITREYDPDRTVPVAGLEVSFREVPHFIRAWACDLRAQNGKRFTFGADCGPNDEIPRLAKGTDLLMLEATEGTTPHAKLNVAHRGHLTAREAGELGRRAQAKRLVLTHFSDMLDGEAVRREGAAGFGNPIELAVAGASFEV